MKKLLSIVIFVLFGVTQLWAASKLTMTARVYVYNEEGGTVAANASETPPASNSSEWDTFIEKSVTVNSSGNVTDCKKLFGLPYGECTVTWTGYQLYYHAKANSGYTFMGWSATNTNVFDANYTSTQRNHSNPTAKYTAKTGYLEYEADLDKGNAPQNWAVFKKIIIPNATGEIDWIILSEATKTLDVQLTKAGEISVSVENISSTPGEIKVKTNNQDVTNGTGTLHLNLTTVSNVEDGDKYKITISETSNSGKAEIIVNIVKKITVTLVRPTIGEGCIQATPSQGGDPKSVCFDDAENKEFSLTDSRRFNNTLTAIPGEGYEFLRWKINGNYLSKDNPYSHYLSNGDQITAEFVPSGTAIFHIVKYESNAPKTNGKEYFSLKDAIDDAIKSDEYKTIVLANKSGILYNLDFTTVDGKKEITIPQGITLLIPGNERYTVATHLRTSDMVQTSGTPTIFRELILPSNTRIKAVGNICVYAPISEMQGHNGKPQTYGQIDMKNDSEILLTNGSILTVFGYITGDYNNSKVIAQSGSTVYEAFQMTDWRGGSQMIMGNMIGNDQRVFPIAQFYIQNIETKLTLQHGATEYVSAAVGVDIDIAGMGHTPLNMNMELITNADITDRGFLRIGAGCELSKWYDGETDKQHYQLDCQDNYTSATAQFGIMYAEMKVSIYDKKLDSQDYVLAVPNNIIMTIKKGINIINKYDLALLAGSELIIDKEATYTSQGNLFVYDKEWNTGYFGASGTELIPITYTAYHYEKYLSDKITYSYLSTGKPYKSKDTYIRVAADVNDAKVQIDGELIVTTTSGVKDGSGFYTTAIHQNGAESTGKSDKPSDYGANITSTSGGVVKFLHIGDKTVTYQKKGDSNVTIPVTNARLRNADGSYSAGGDKNMPTGMYRYNRNAGKWLIPNQDDIEIQTWEGNDFTVYLPNITDIEVICDITGSDIDVDKFTYEILDEERKHVANSRFAIGTPKYENGELVVPLTYTPVNVHNVNNPYMEEYLVINWSSQTEDKSCPIPLIATEDYTPKFNVEIIGDGDFNATDLVYKFLVTTAQTPRTAQVSITPNSATTAQLLSAENWNISATANPPFDAALGDGEQFLSDASVSFTPQAGQKYEGNLTIKATYKDAAEKEIPSATTTVVLSGVGALQTNGLQFDSDIAKTIIQGEAPIKNIFSNLGSGIDKIRSITCTYDNGTDASALVTVTRETDNYTLTALEPNNPAITEARNVTVTVHQDPSEIMAGTEDEPITLTVTVLPPAVWNWADLYFGSTNTIPVTPSKDGNWSLELTNDPNNLISLTNISEGEEINYQAIVGEGAAGQVYQAEFVFTQGTYTKEFVSNIYANPRVLGYCVEYSRQFRGVSTKNSTVTFAEGHDAIPPTTTFRPADIWEIMMIGIPDKLTFTASGDKIWYISESSTGVANSYTPIVSGEVLSGEQILQLRPTTNYVKFEYGAGSGNNGTISNLCISALELASAQDVVYFPIYKNGDATTKEIVFTHSEENIDFTIQEANSGLTINQSLPVEISSDDDNESYYQTTVTISDGEDGDLQRIVKGEYTLTATMDGADPINVTIYADEVPQGLPIHLATDDVKRYHFIAIEELSRHARWDAGSRSIIFQDPGNNYITRSVTLTFEGAPSRISFSSKTQTGWTVEQSATGIADSYNPCVAQKDGDKITYSLHYTTHYVRINYLSPGREVVSLSNLVIEGDPMLIVDPEELEFSDETKENTLTLTTINLNKIRIEVDNIIDFQITHGQSTIQSECILQSIDYPNALGKNKVGKIFINAEWISDNLANDGLITIYNVLGDDSEKVLAKVKLVAAGKYLRLDNAATTGIYTGIPDGTRDMDNDGILSDVESSRKYTFHGNEYTDYHYHEVNLTNAFAPDGTALFDYLFVYGETTTNPEKGGGTDITAPAGENGSNALTPYYVYERATDVDGNYDRYRFVTMVEDANVGDKAEIDGVIVSSTETSEDEDGEAVTVPIKYINVGKALSVYITGFAPYATTGYTKGDEGVFFFRGNAGSKLDVYLEDAHIFARNKMQTGQPFYSRGTENHRLYNPKFTEGYARGSGGVLVFECLDDNEHIDAAVPFEVSIHTIGNNLLKSNYGCFNYFFGMDPFQISAPIHVRLRSEAHVLSKTTVNFDDIWPTKLDEIGQITESKRTNGFLGLKKLNNNAPSIDLGNPYTTINFNGGQVQLQNAQIVSTNYKTTLAISYRAGEYGGDKVGLKFAEGIGTDAVGGTVNFNDGTVTIEPMWVQEAYKNYYMIDKYEDGNEIKRKVGEVKDPNDPNKKLDVFEYQTTCLRCPKNTYVYGGSICWLRACQHVTSKGGAPMGGGGADVGQYIYTFDSKTDEKDEKTNLVTKLQFPANIKDKNGNELAGYFDVFYPNHQYGTNSITPDGDGYLYFWIPEGYGGVSAEKDKLLTTWKTCMTEITAGAQGIEGSVGGITPIERNEEIKYMLYCQIDQNIKTVITAGSTDGNNNYTYKAPVKVPSVAQGFYGSKYTYIPPISVSEELQHEVTSEQPYEVTDKVYYITTATADVWQTFTAPFDVAKIWVVEAFSETELEKVAEDASEAGKNARTEVLLTQAEHNADFAAFFGVAMAIGTTDPLETILNDFIEWGKEYDQQVTDKYGNPKDAVYNSATDGAYTLRDIHELVPYDGSNWSDAHFYLNHTIADWEITVDEDETPIYTPHWEIPTKDANGCLMRKGESYSLLFPYCTGCFDENGERDFWDYWSGKFLIFESMDYSSTEDNDKVHVIEGSNFLKEDWTEEELEAEPDGIFVPDNLPTGGKAKLTGNSTFAFFDSENTSIYAYYPITNAERFNPYSPGEVIYPTSSFLIANIPNNQYGMPARGVMRSGEIIYDQPDDDNNGNQNGTSGGGHMPTVGGGNDMFITAIEGGINIAVAEPQMVKVMSSTGAVLFAGYVTTATDVQLPTHGIYIVSGENEVQKIMH